MTYLPLNSEGYDGDKDQQASDPAPLSPRWSQTRKQGQGAHRWRTERLSNGQS